MVMFLFPSRYPVAKIRNEMNRFSLLTIVQLNININYTKFKLFMHWRIHTNYGIKKGVHNYTNVVIYIIGLWLNFDFWFNDYVWF